MRETLPCPAWMEHIEHTADVAIVVRGDDDKELFARAAWAMFSLLADMQSVRPLQTTAVTVDAGDVAALLGRWLSELNFLHQTQRALFCRFDVAELANMRLRATVCGEPFDNSRHAIRTEIKGVTLHKLRVEGSASGWCAEIVFDI
jgi:SHS2 domain-containing protein